MTPQFDSLAIDVSDGCNLACDYCFEAAGAHQPHYKVKPKTLITGVDYFLAVLRNPEKRDVHFHFGRREPLMNAPLFERIVEHIERWAENEEVTPHFHLTTNGTAVSRSVMDFLCAHPIRLRVSLDGPSQIHDRHRRLRNGGKTAALVIKTIQTLSDLGAEVTVNAVYAPDVSIERVFSFFMDAGVERVDFFPLWMNDDAGGRCFRPALIGQFCDEMRQLTERMVRVIVDHGEWPFTRIVQLEKQLQYLFGFRQSPFFCGAGRTYIGVSGAGTFHPCLKFVNTGQWELGDLENGFDFKAARRFQSNAAPKIDQLQPCSQCDIKKSCKGLCYVDRMDQSRARLAMDFYCTFQKAFHELSGVLYERFKNSRPEALVGLAGMSAILDVDDPLC